MRSIWISCVLMAGVLVTAAPRARQQAAAPAAQVPTLASRLVQIRDAARAPAVAGVVFRADDIVASGVVGERKLGDPAAATMDDRWHIGSITKTFTSTLVARYIERGEFTWTTTLGELLGAERARAYAPVTIEQLLAHRSGLPANVPAPLTMAVAQSGEPGMAQRARLADELLATPPASAPGAAFLYSNAGYIVMGAALEARAGRAWERLVRDEVLDPVGLRSAGFGPPGDPDAVDQPWGHRQTGPATIVPMAPGPMSDNPEFLGPAGRLHMTLADLARWGQEHLRGEMGRDGVVSAASFQRLHRAPVDGADYALGWAIRPTGRQRILWHNGSNTMWYAIVGFDADENLGVALVTNGPIGTGRTLDSGLMQIFDDFAR